MHAYAGEFGFLKMKVSGWRNLSGTFAPAAQILWQSNVSREHTDQLSLY